MTLVTFSLVNNSDRYELVKSGLVINNEKEAVRDYINRDTLINKSSDEELQTKVKIMSKVQ